MGFVGELVGRSFRPVYLVWVPCVGNGDWRDGRLPTRLAAFAQAGDC